jgi:hypothetical protein
MSWVGSLREIKDVISRTVRQRMLTPIEPPTEEFRQLASPEVEAALRDADTPDDPVVREVTRIMRAYGDTMAELVALYGHVPDDFQLAPRWPIELVAAKLFKEQLDEYAGKAAE